MFRQASYSVLTQALSSAANFVVSIAMLRVLELSDFGYYFFLYLCASFASAFTASMTGTVYPICRPRMGLAARGYEASYNALNLLIAPMVIALFATGAYLFVTPPAGITPWHVGVFVAALVLVDNIKLQAGANGIHRTIFLLEAARQGALLTLIAVLAIWHTVSLPALVLVHGLTGLAAVSALLVALRWRPSFRRLRWVAARHYAHARHLLPANLVSTLHSTAIQFAVTQQFGPQAVGLLRSAELPYSALNPLKLSLALFLPGAIYRLEQKPVAEKRRVLVRAGLATLAGSLAIGLAIWAGSVLVLPVLTGKPYPFWLGLTYGFTSSIMIVLVAANYYLTVLDGANLVLRQAILGAGVALCTYAAAAPFVAHLAAPVSLTACFVAMTIYAVFSLYRKAWLGQHSVRPARADPVAAGGSGAGAAMAAKPN